MQVIRRRLVLPKLTEVVAIDRRILVLCEWDLRKGSIRPFINGAFNLGLRQQTGQNHNDDIQLRELKPMPQQGTESTGPEEQLRHPSWS